jgi:O-acetylhomoserine (thiol)-lyase
MSAENIEERELNFDTLKVRAGYKPEEHNYAVSVPIYESAAFDLGSPERAYNLFSFSELGHIYTRVSNPTVAVLEQRVAALDGAAGAVALASGMAAITDTLLNVAEGGGHILTAPRLYGGTVDSFKKIYPKFNVHIDISDNFDNPAKLAEDITDETRAIFVETISNPNAALVDIEAISAVAHAHDIPLIVDNTFATPYLFNPLKHGADIVVYSGTKALGGHGNVIAGLVLESGKFDWNNGKFPQFSEKYYTLRNKDGNQRSFLEVFPKFPFTARIRANYLAYFGASLSPFDAYLVLIGLETLSERVKKQVENAKEIISYLEGNPHVAWVSHPSAQGSPYSALARKYFPKGAGAIFSFGFKGDDAQIDQFINATKIFSYHANVGDSRSLIVNSPKTTHGELTSKEQKRAGIAPETVRLSIGLEDVSDLIADLSQAFKQVFD